MTPGELAARLLDLAAEVVTWPIGLAWGLINVRRYRHRYDRPDPQDAIPLWFQEVQ